MPHPLVDYLQGRAEPPATAEDGRVCVAMILGPYYAAGSGRRVPFALQQRAGR